MEAVSPYQLARKLVRQHRDPSFVRAQVLRDFTVAPPIRTILRLRAEYEAENLQQEGRACRRKVHTEAIPPQMAERTARTNQILGCKNLLRAIMAAGGHR